MPRQQAQQHAEPATAARSLSSSTAPGSRALSTREVVSKASGKVIERITLEAIQQSFPDFVETDAAFIEELTTSINQDLKSGFDQAYQMFFADGPFKDFDTRANEVDKVYAAAIRRRHQREAAQEAWRHGRDPVVAIRAAVIPNLISNAEQNRNFNTQLSSSALQRTHRLQTLQAEGDVLENDVRAMLDTVRQAKQSLNRVDDAAIQQQTVELAVHVGQDKL